MVKVTEGAAKLDLLRINFIIVCGVSIACSVIYYPIVPSPKEVSFFQKTVVLFWLFILLVSPLFFLYSVLQEIKSQKLNPLRGLAYILVAIPLAALHPLLASSLGLNSYGAKRMVKLAEQSNLMGKSREEVSRLFSRPYVSNSVVGRKDEESLCFRGRWPNVIEPKFCIILEKNVVTHFYIED